MKYVFASIAVLAAGLPAYSAAAQEEQPEISISGSAALTSDYRFRGVSQTDKGMAVQGGLTLAHESGVYTGLWASNLSAWGTFGGANMELDLIGGYKLPLSDAVTLDVGVTWYMYPSGADKTDFVEPYAKFSGVVGPTSLTAGVAYAPKQQALGRWYETGADAANGVYNNPGDKEDNLYLWGDAAVAIAQTPFTAKAHIGHSNGNKGLGPNATSITPTGDYWDWSLGLDASWRNLTLGVAYVDTSISKSDAAYLQPGFNKGQDGTGSIANSTAVVTLSAAF